MHFSEEINADILALPPEVDVLTDEENVNDDELGAPKILDIAGTTELDLSSDEDDDNVPLARLLPSTSRHEEPLSKRRIVDKPNWQKISPTYKPWPAGNSANKKFENVRQDMETCSMLETFEKLMIEESFEHIVAETKRYAISNKNKQNFVVCVEDIKIFLGFLIFSGYHSLPSERDY
ncbi:hypothetical protein CBL_10528 [Carabus blaptoides fortunei]